MIEFRHACKRLADWIFPFNCASCGKPLDDGGYLCGTCADKILTADDACPVCARPGTGGRRCGACQKQAPYFDATLAASRYREPVDGMVKAFKFAGKLNNAAVLTAMLIDRVRRGDGELPELIAPVPLHRIRMRQRGYNQSMEIAREVARNLHIPVSSDLLKRVKATVPQTELHHKERRKNVHNAFVLKQEPNASHIALVDDVMTTGSTMNECAKLLKQAGVKRVSAWVVARVG